MAVRIVFGGLGVAVSAIALTTAAVSAAGSSASVRAPITQAQSGKTIRLAKGETATLRLSNRWSWSEPRLSKSLVDLTPVEYFVDPGFSEWQIDARARGTVIIRSTGKPACSGCALTARAFRITILVS